MQPRRVISSGGSKGPLLLHPCKNGRWQPSRSTLVPPVPQEPRWRSGRGMPFCPEAGQGPSTMPCAAQDRGSDALRRRAMPRLPDPLPTLPTLNSAMGGGHGRPASPKAAHAVVLVPSSSVTGGRQTDAVRLGRAGMGRPRTGGICIHRSPVRAGYTKGGRCEDRR